MSTRNNDSGAYIFMAFLFVIFFPFSLLILGVLLLASYFQKI